MNRKIYVFVIGILMQWVGACQESEPVIRVEGQQEDSTVLTQYGEPFRQIPQTDEIVMYEVNLRAFSPDGNLQGVIDQLDHIDSLGVNVIWLMPIHPIGQINSVNSPYSVRDYQAVGEEFGSLEDLQELTDRAHSRGMAVIMDWVANHTAWDHPWMRNKDWYTQDSGGDIVHPPGTNWLDVADLDYSNAEMREEMKRAMLFWIYRANIDGFRCDYADGVPFDFWKNAWETLDTIPDREFVLFAEGTRSNHFQAGFDLNFSWQFYGTIKDVFNGASVSRIISAHENEYQSTPSGKHWVRFTTNHDESAWDATPIQLFDGEKGALAASVVTVFTGGVPLIYGSQEVGRVDNVPFFSRSVINFDGNSAFLTSYQDMLQFYAQSSAAKSSSLIPYTHEDVVCFRKSDNDEEILVITNLRDREVTFPIASELEGSVWTDGLTEESVTLLESIQLAPYQYLILTK